MTGLIEWREGNNHIHNIGINTFPKHSTPITIYKADKKWQLLMKFTFLELAP